MISRLDTRRPVAGGRGEVLTTCRAFWRDRRAASAVEFAIVASPFFFLMMAMLQMSLYYFSQSALDSGVVTTAETIRRNFVQGTSPPTAASIKASVATKAGGLIVNDPTLAVDIRQLSTLAAGSLPISDAVTDYGTPSSALVLRAQKSVVNFVPGISGLTYVRSSAIIRRQGT